VDIYFYDWHYFGF